MLRRIGRLIFQLIPLWTWRVFVYGSLGALVVVGGMILGLRYWVLPNIDAYRGDLEQSLTRATGQRITIGEIGADWEGLRPQFSLGKVVVYDQAGRAALELGHIDTSLSWISLIVFEPRFHTLQIHRPSLDIRRAQDGTLSVAGIELGDSKDGGGLADWLFRQREVIVTEAAISWIDERRRAPELRLGDVTLRLQSEYFRHRFELNAAAPAELAGRIDLRADLVGRSVSKIAEWQGQVYAQLEYVDLAASKQWIDMPIEIAQGRGAVRAWVDVAQQRVTAVTADVQLSDLKARLAPELEPLDLASLSGRVGWRGWGTGFEVSGHGLQGVAVVGHSFETDDFSLRRVHEQAKKPARTEVKATVVDLDALAQLVEHLPIDQALREEIKRYAPRGKLYELTGKWTGAWAAGQYELKSRFEDLAFEAVDDAPGWRSVTGSVEANEKGGVLTLAKHPLRIDLPKVFSEPLDFDEFSGQVRWTASGRQIDFRLSDVRFANTDLAGSLSAIYRSTPGEAGSIDLNGALTRASAAGVARYLPLVVSKETREWVRSSLVAGQSNDVKLKLKGNLAEFPFDRNSKGIFEVTAKARDGVLDYANGWPRIENVTAELAFTGSRMTIRASSGRILGAQVSGVQVTIPDLVIDDEILEMSGDAEGPTAEFVRFIAESPVAGMIDRATEGIEAQGAGRLSLRLTMPLRRPKDSRVAGSYLFQGNRLRVHSDLPPLEQVTGRVEFTEASVRGASIAAQLFGGPLLIDIATQDGTVTATASGRSTVQALREHLNLPILRELRGGAEWRGSVHVRAKQTDFTVESDLRGLASNLPPPLSKAAGDSLALRLERRASGNDGDRIDVRLGNVLSARFMRHREGQQLVLERGAIGFGVEPPEVQGPGLWVRGTVAALDLDRWRAVADVAPGGSAALPPLAGIDLKLGALDVLSRRFHDVSVNAGQEAGEWRARVSARELAGEIGWRPQGKGRIVARLERLSLPESPKRIEAAAPAQKGVEYPALDVVVEDFQHASRSLGRLQMLAVAEGSNWQIDRLELSNADGTLTADGMWQWQAREPRTQMKFRLEVADIGKLLTRLGYPEGVKGGTANLSGVLSWTGAPQDLDMPSLAGTMSVDAAKGRFVKLEPGIGKLLSILSLQALPRRVALDFKDVFSEGFTFDTISGEVKVRSGVASTERFRINGSSATVVMSGEVDLARETQKLRVRVVPSIGDSVATLTALLGGPVVGIGVFLAQRLLNDPLGQIVAYDYSVTGTWADPTVVKLGIDRAEPG
ncbi:MAG: TIGR02099 family protein [Betaproteobacteria bacterium]|nr:MAG: TIGR02099 family protein [Betaproteobacteria bacterium]